MRMLGTVVALALVLALVATGRAGDPAGKGQKKGGKHVHGVVVAVDRDKDKDTGTCTVRVRLGKKGDPNAETVEKKFAVTEATRFERVIGRKGERETRPASFAAVEKGRHVLVRARGDVAEEVKVLEHKKGVKKDE
jgi:hypothetical protein